MKNFLHRLYTFSRLLTLVISCFIPLHTLYAMMPYESTQSFRSRHPALNLRPPKHFAITQRYKKYNDTSSEQVLGGCSLHRIDKLPAQRTRVVMDDNDIADNTACKQIIATIFFVSICLSTCFACSSIAALAIKGQKI